MGGSTSRKKNENKLIRRNIFNEGALASPQRKQKQIDDDDDEEYKLDSALLRRTSKAQLFKLSRSLTQGRVKKKVTVESKDDSNTSFDDQLSSRKERQKKKSNFFFDEGEENSLRSMNSRIIDRSIPKLKMQDFIEEEADSELQLESESQSRKSVKEEISVSFQIEDVMDECRSGNDSPINNESQNPRKNLVEQLRLLSYKIRNYGMKKKFVFYSLPPPTSNDNIQETVDEDKTFQSEIIDFSEKSFKKANPMRRILKRNEKSYLYHSGMAFISRKGNLESLSNQDSFFIYANSLIRFIAVFDGHGSSGHLVSHYAMKFMMKYLLEEPMSFLKPYRVFKELFAKVEQSLIIFVQEYNAKSCNEDKINLNFSGVSCTLAAISENYIHIAQCGDTRGLIGRRVKVCKKPPLQITNDHVPSNVLERIRIYARGGEMKKLNSDYSEKVFVRGRVYPGLHITRSIGDIIGSLVGVISEPEIITYEISQVNDHFLLLGSRSTFLYLDDFEINSLLQHFSDDNLENAMETLYKRVKASWIQNEGMFDDITMILNFF